MLKLIVATTVLLVPVVYSLGVETAEPEASLKPRHFNPHPYQYDRSTLQNINYEASASNTLESPSPTNGIYSQGPVQFPSNTNEYNENDLQQLPHPYEQLAIKSRSKVKTNIRRLDYDDLTSSVSKKHYAFSYTVRDATSGDDFSHTQKQEDGAVKGSYKVQLPDGRTQIVKYTADNNGYNAQVTYVEGQIGNDYAVESTQTPSSAPALASAQPIYDYYRSLQNEQRHHQHENYNNDDYADNKVYNPYNYYSTTTPTPYYAHSEGISRGHFENHIQNVHIKTYNTAPHHQHENNDVVVTPLARQVIVYPTTPAPYKDVHVLPTPRTLVYSTSSPYTKVVSAKSTNVLPAYDYYLDYGYKNVNGHGQASISNHPSKNLFVASNTALYYKTKK